MSRVGRVQINRPGDGGPIIIPDPPPEPGTYLELIAADGAVAAWPLNENDGASVYADVIGSLHATLDKGTTSDWASGPIGPSSDHSPHFDGSGGLSDLATDVAIVTAHDLLLEVGTGDFTMEVWVQADAFPPAATAFCPMTLLKPSVDNYMLSELAGPTTGSGTYRMADTNNVGAVSPPDYDDQLLHHCVFTRRSGSYFTIVDGVEVGTVTPGAAVAYDTTEVINLAGIQYTPLPGYDLYALAGQIAWCAWYPVALSTDQAAAHFALG